MKYGCCSNFLGGGSVENILRIASNLQAVGFDYVELSVVDCMALSDTEQRKLTKGLAETGFRSEVINSLFPRELKTTGPDANPDRVRDWYRKAFDMSKDLGAEGVVFGSPYSKSYPLGFDRVRAYEQIVSLHREMDAYAGSLGMTLLIEPCHRYECNIINTFADGVALTKTAGGTHTKVLFDYYHFTRNGETLTALGIFGRDCLGHIHFACPFHPGEPERTFPLDRREWDYEPFAETLQSVAYNGRISIEAVCKDFNGQANRSLELLKLLFGSH